MIKLLIVDDEVHIREGISKVINWKELDIDVLPAAASAEEAFETIRKQKPDILLTDIRMTGRNGLELADLAKQHDQEIEILILSGYDDFHYAQQAMKKGVRDYLLKTSEPMEIQKAVLSAKQAVLQKRSLKSDTTIKNQAFRDQLFKKLILEGDLSQVNSAVIPTIFPTIRLDETSYRVAILTADGWGVETADQELLLFSIHNMLKELVYCETLIDDKQIILLLPNVFATEAEPSFIRAIEQIEDFLKCTVTVSIGSPVTAIDKIHHSFHEAEAIFPFYTILPNETVITPEKVKNRTGGHSICTTYQETEIVALLNNGNPITLHDWIRQAISSERAHPQANPESLLEYANSIILIGLRWWQGVSNQKSSNVSLLKLADLALLEEEIYRRLYYLMNLYREKVIFTASSKIERALSYIQHNLHRVISLQEVAEHVQWNQNYFSEMFKKEIGMTYVEYVKQQRIKRAQELLRNSSDMRISDVARQVGYEDVKYFSQIFKAATGLTPSKFQKR